ncbi:type III pantothenate kinase [Tichowtungia aerotolerans]|uniref:Type III pantothenate kinase n=1 Tax=Tichowtungia aerotolerans TaxID=2697043 RepID=A0A6P1ME13_9BACT|nr:type III pantothenate kinase [Tichowtungia aerotolerans]QHI70804.1 type III pantothenate kinase [Tichowtungia aerotolerans]
MQTLVIDIGNTSTSLGVYRNGRVTRVQRTPSKTPALELKKIPERAVVASVKPGVNARWKRFLKQQGVRDVLFVSHQLNLGVPVTYPKPERIGADRLADASEAAATFGAPVVVCDFGTALTFDIIKKDEGYVGGIICPGLPLMFDYLSEKTAQLPHIKPVKTSRVIGKSTAEAMRIGARIGYRGMVREIINELKEELGNNTQVCATGGFAGWVLQGFDDSITIDPLFTLKGVGRIGMLNQ